MKVFDFNHEEFLKHSKIKQKWLLEHYKKPLTEKQFILQWKELHNYVKGKKRKHLCPSACKKKYYHLVNKFDFFGTLSK